MSILYNIYVYCFGNTLYYVFVLILTTLCNIQVFSYIPPQNKYQYIVYTE